MFCQTFNLPLVRLSNICTVDTTDGNPACIRDVLIEENIEILGHKFKTRLLSMQLVGFDVVLGMDWLAANSARIVCNNNSIEIRTPTGKIIIVQGDNIPKPIKFVSVLKAASYLRKQGMVYLISVIDSIKVEELKEISIVSEYSDVFPEDLPGEPPDREVEFRIHIISGTALIAKAPYQLASSEMLELKTQLEELLSKGFIRLSSSP